MDDRRKERIAENEASFREINERLSQGLRQVPGNPEYLEFICECGYQTCDQHVQLSFSEYERVRGDSRRFVILPGHIIPDAERLVSSGAEWLDARDTLVTDLTPLVAEQYRLVAGADQTVAMRRPACATLVSSAGEHGLSTHRRRHERLCGIVR